MASEIPVVRHFLACQVVTISPDEQGIVLRDPITAIARLPGEVGPMIRQLGLFAMLANGRGEHDFVVELMILHRGRDGMQAEERQVFATAPVRRDLGQDPMAIHVLPAVNLTVSFTRSGQHAFYLLCDG